MPANTPPIEEPKEPELPEHLKWRGDGPMPPYWYAEDGTKVYRSYSDYCDD